MGNPSPDTLQKILSGLSEGALETALSLGSERFRAFTPIQVEGSPVLLFIAVPGTTFFVSKIIIVNSAATAGGCTLREIGGDDLYGACLSKEETRTENFLPALEITKDKDCEAVRVGPTGSFVVYLYGYTRV